METPAAPSISQSAPALSPSPKPPGSQGSVKTDPAVKELAVLALQQFRIGLSQSLLYTEETVQFERSRDATFTALNALLGAIGDFKLSIAKSEALINSERIEGTNALRSANEQIEKIMSAACINGLQFSKGMTAAELGPFLQMLARRKFGSTDGAKINENLRGHGIEHIQVDELRYVALSAEEKVISGEAPMLTQHSAAQKVVSELVDATLESINKVQDGEARVQLRAEITDQLIERDPSMLAGMLAVASQRLNQTVSEAEAALAAVPKRDGQMLRDVLVLANSLGEKGLDPDSESGKAVQRLVESLTSPYKLRSEAIVSQVNLDGLSAKVLPDWLRSSISSMQSEAAEQRLEGILRQSPCTLLDEKMFPQISDVLDELSVARMDEEAEKLTAHIAGALQAPTKRDRMKAVERLSILLAGTMEQSSQAVKILEDALLNACTHETCDEVMKLLVKHLSERCVCHYQLENYSRAVEHLEWIVSLEESSRLALRDEGANIARDARELLSKSKFAETLADSLLEDGEKGSTAKRMIMALGANVWGIVLKRLQTEVDGEKAKLIASHLKDFGRDAVQLFFKTLQQEQNGEVVLRLLELATTVADEASLWAAIPSLLRHTDNSVKAKVLELTIRYDGSQASKTLAAMFKEESDPEKRRTWISALARLKDPSGQRILLEELETLLKSGQPDEVILKQLVEVFESLGNTAVVAPLTTFLRTRWRGLGLSPNESGPTKIATMIAMRGLARFYHDPVASEVLERARKDKDSDISRLALVCLRGIVAAEQHQQASETGLLAAVRKEDTTPTSGSTTVVLKKHRGFEAFQITQDADKVFQPGMAFGGATSGSAGSGKHKVQPPKPPAVVNLKPTLEGQFQDHKLPSLIRMVGGRDGILKVLPANGEAMICIKDRHVVSASFAGKLGIAALVEIDEIKEANFAYYLSAHTGSSDLSLDLDQVQDALTKYRDQTDQNLFL